jgi:hypothetical protein
MPLPNDECAGALTQTTWAFQHAASGFLARMLDG